MKIRIKYSKEYDIERIMNTIKARDFFIKHGYKTLFPKGVGFDTNDKDIEKGVEGEYKTSKYQKVEDFVNKEWRENNQNIDSFFANSKYNFLDEYIIHLTSYGSGGSYFFPNRVIINIDYNYKYGHFANVIHEIIHLAVEEPVVQKYDLNQREKESIVDHMILTNLKQVFPEYNYQSSSPSLELLEKIGWTD